MSGYDTSPQNPIIRLLRALRQRQEKRSLRALERNLGWIAEVYATPTVEEEFMSHAR